MNNIFKSQYFVLCGLIVLLSLSINKTYAQSYSFIHYGVEQGLVQTQVKTMVQDNDGNLWAGTIAGASMYNGIEFKSITKENGLVEDWITASLKDAEGNLWFGHWGGGVSIYKYSEKQLSHLTLEEILEFKTISTIYQDKYSLIWLGSIGGGICVYNPLNNKYASIKKEQGLSSDVVLSIISDSDGNIWCATPNGITRFNPSKIVEKLTKQDVIGKTDDNLLLKIKYYNSENGLPDNETVCLLHTSSKKILVGTNYGIVVIEENNDDQNFRIFNIENSGIVTNTIKYLFEDSYKNIWVATPQGLMEISHDLLELSKIDNLTEEEKKSYTKIYTTKNGLNWNNVNNVLEDREQNIWVATELGLNLFRDERFLMFNEKDGLSSSIVWSILEDDNSNIWLATEEGGITIFKNNTVDYINTAHGLPDNSVQHLCKSKEYIWIATQVGCAVYSKSQKKIITIPAISELMNIRIYYIDYDEKSTVWFGTTQGAYAYNEQTGQIKHYTKDNGLTAEKIRLSFCDSKGNVWLAGPGGDLTVFDGINFKYFGKENGLERKVYFCLTEDQSGNIWAGVYGSGVYRLTLNADSLQIKNYTVKDGLNGAIPFLIICDSINNIWVGTNLGIDKIDQQTNIITHYGKNEGFLGIETNNNAAYLDKNGNLWFGTIMGVVKYNPKKDFINKIEPVTLVASLQISRKDADFPVTAVFDYKQDNLSFYCTGISLTNPGKVLYRYQLEGLETEWTPPTKSNFIDYTNLSPGEYSFKVISCNNDRIWNTKPVIYSFVITPPFWRTWWFYMLTAGLIITMLYSFYKLRIRNLKLQQEYLQEQVNIRTKELKEEKEKLEDAKKDIEEKNKKLWVVNQSVLTEKEKVENIKNILEAKNKDITDSINYAKKIQNAILPNESLIIKYLPGFFLLYEPKDIVSGDFYWYTKRDNKIIIAAADCTGHGVPGAFMSLIGYTLLNQIIEGNEIYDPSKVLMLLNEGIRQALHQQEDRTEAMDGLDIALVTIDMSSHKIIFAGALRPLFLIRDGNCIEYKGSKLTVGGHKMRGEVIYHSYEIPIQIGDRFYIFSDGVTDQFGGPKNRKYSKKQWREFLIKIADVKFPSQSSAIQKELNTWRSNLDQTDDIIVIGVKF